MTTFEPRGENFEMRTLIAATTARTLETIRDVGGISVTEAIRRTIGLHMFWRRVDGADGLLIANLQRLDVLAPPTEMVENDDEPPIKLRQYVNPDVHAYLEPMTSKDNPADLLDFWRSAVSFYSRVSEAHALGAAFHIVHPDGTGIRTSQFDLAAFYA